MESTTERLELQRELEIAASPGDGLGVPRRSRRRRSRWWGRAARLDPRPGGELLDRGDPRAAWRAASSSSVEPPRRLVYTWGWEAGRRRARTSCRRGRARSRSSSCPPGAGRRLRLTHRDLPDPELGREPRPRLGPLPRPARRRGPKAAIPGPTPGGRGSDSLENGPGARGPVFHRVDSQRRREMTMGKYVLVYKGGGMAATEEEQKAAMEAWGAWFGGLGDVGRRHGQPVRRLGGGVRGRRQRCRRLGADRLLDPVGLRASTTRSRKARGCPIFALGRRRRGLRDARDVGGGGQAGFDAGLPASPLCGRRRRAASSTTVAAEIAMSWTLIHSRSEWKSFPPVKMFGVGRPMLGQA